MSLESVDKSFHPRYNADGSSVMNGVIYYVLYSSDNQHEEIVEGQLRKRQMFAAKNNVTILNTQINRVFSAKTDIVNQNIIFQGIKLELKSGKHKE